MTIWSYGNDQMKSERVHIPYLKKVQTCIKNFFCLSKDWNVIISKVQKDQICEKTLIALLSHMVKTAQCLTAKKNSLSDTSALYWTAMFPNSYTHYSTKSVIWPISHLKILRFGTDRSEETVQTGSSLIRVYSVCHSFSNFWTYNCMVKPLLVKFLDNYRNNFRCLSIYTHSNNFNMVVLPVVGDRISSSNPAGGVILQEPTHLSHDMRKPVFAICEQQRRRSACASTQSDQCLCYSLLR